MTSDKDPSKGAKSPDQDADLNPDLHIVRDETYGPDQEGHDPMDSVSVKSQKEGRAWPWIWGIVAIACILITIYLMLP